MGSKSIRSATKAKCRIGLMEDVRNDAGKFSRRKVAVHRLVARAFIPQDDERQKYIDHIDSNRDNSDMKNLRWVNASQNKTYGYDTKGRKVVLQLDMQGNLIKRWASAVAIKEAHADYNIGHISSVCLKRKGSHSHKGFKWAYETETVKKEVRNLYEDEEFVNIGTFDDYDFQDYFVSSYGMIKNARGMVLRPFDDRGYVAYMLYDKHTGKSHQVLAHRAVAFKFCSGRTAERNIVDHRDEVRDNNNKNNLRWVVYDIQPQYLPLTIARTCRTQISSRREAVSIDCLSSNFTFSRMYLTFSILSLVAESP